MKNGIFLFLILFLGSLGFHVTEKMMFHGDYVVGGFYFIAVSLGIAYLASHFSKKEALLPIQRVINVVVLAIFTAYGILTGTYIMSNYAANPQIGAEGLLYMLGSAIVVYGLVKFYQRDHKLHNKLQAFIDKKNQFFSQKLRFQRPSNITE